MKLFKTSTRLLIVASLLFSFSLAAIAPATGSADQAQPTNTAHKKSASKKKTHKKKTSKVTTKTVTETHSIPYTTEKQDDDNLAQGQTAVAQAGQNGTEKRIYKLTYTKGKKTKKTLISHKVVVAAIPQIINVGTYVAPAPATNTYTNVDGNQVERPDSNSAGATGICNDGTYTHAIHHQGACSSHGGVAQWL